MNLDMTKLEPLLGKMVDELGAAANAALVLTGDKLGLFRELAAGTALTSAELAAKTGTRERYIREWLAAQAASSPRARSIPEKTPPPEGGSVWCLPAGRADQGRTCHSTPTPVMPAGAS